jgi:hypothetical protein
MRPSRRCRAVALACHALPPLPLNSLPAAVLIQTSDAPGVMGPLPCLRQSPVSCQAYLHGHPMKAVIA